MNQNLHVHVSYCSIQITQPLHLYFPSIIGFMVIRLLPKFKNVSEVSMTGYFHIKSFTHKISKI